MPERLPNPAGRPTAAQSWEGLVAAQPTGGTDPMARGRGTPSLMKNHLLVLGWTRSTHCPGLA